MVKICVTGHRDLLYPDEVAPELGNALEYLKALHGNIEVSSAIAAGADTLFVHAAKKLGIPFKILLPISPDQYEKDFTGKQNLDSFHKLLKENPYQVFYQGVVHTQDERNQTYLNAGKQLIDQADIVVAVWDGRPAKGVGGTADMVAYAIQQGKRVHYINGIREKQSDLPEIRKAKKLREELDEDAQKYKYQKFQPTWIAGIAIGLLAVFCLAVALSFNISPLALVLLALGELVFLSSSFILLARYARGYKEKYQLFRRDAEILRFHLWYYEADINSTVFDAGSEQPSAKVLEAIADISTLPPTQKDLENAKRMAWSLANAQAQYHEKMRIIPFGKRLEKMELALEILKYVFFGVVVVKLIAEWLVYKHIMVGTIDPHYIVPWLNFLCITIPPIYAALEGVNYFNQWKRNKAVSEQTVQGLKQSMGAIMLCTTREELVKEALQLQNILELENRDWAVRIKESEIDARV